MIDPQGQANKWIKNMEAGSSLDVSRITNINLLRCMENCIRVSYQKIIERDRTIHYF